MKYAWRITTEVRGKGELMRNTNLGERRWDSLWSLFFFVIIGFFAQFGGTKTDV